MATSESDDTDSEPSVESTPENYIIEIDDTFRVSADEVANSEVAVQRVLEQIGTDPFNVYEGSVAGVEGVENEVLEAFIEEFGDSGPASGNSTEWIVGDEHRAAWVPPSQDSINDVAITDFVSPGESLRVRISDESEKGEYEAFRLRSPDSDVTTLLSVSMAERVASVLDRGVDYVRANARIADDQAILIDIPTPGWILVPPLPKSDSDAEYRVVE